MTFEPLPNEHALVKMDDFLQSSTVNCAQVYFAIHFKVESYVEHDYLRHRQHTSVHICRTHRAINEISINLRIIKVISSLSGHALEDCSLGHKKHIIQYQQGSRVNIFPSVFFYNKNSELIN